MPVLKILTFLFQAQSPESVVALGSSRDLLFEGGPQPWQMDPSGYFETCQSDLFFSLLLLIILLHYVKYIN